MSTIDAMHRQLGEVVSRKRRTVPEAGRRLWGIFCALSATRTYHGSGPNPISFVEIDAYSRLTGTLVRPIDLAGLRLIDDAWIIAQLGDVTRRSGARQNGKGALSAPRNAQPLTAAAFDAVIG